jgi:aminoglycoside phosphotransferase
MSDIKHEAKVADMLREQGLSVPEVLKVDESCCILPYPYLIQEQIPGEKLGTLLFQQDESEIEKIYEALGGYYRSMHSIKNDTSCLFSDNPGQLLYPVSLAILSCTEAEEPSPCFRVPLLPSLCFCFYYLHYIQFDKLE